MWGFTKNLVSIVLFYCSFHHFYCTHIVVWIPVARVDLSLPTYFIFVYEIIILSSVLFFMEWVSWCILPARQTFQWDVSLCLQFDYGQAFFVSSNFFLRSFASYSREIRTTTCLQPLLQYKLLKERGYLDKLNLIKLKKIVETLSIYYETTNKL